MGLNKVNERQTATEVCRQMVLGTRPEPGSAVRTNRNLFATKIARHKSNTPHCTKSPQLEQREMHRRTIASKGWELKTTLTQGSQDTLSTPGPTRVKIQALCRNVQAESNLWKTFTHAIL